MKGEKRKESAVTQRLMQFIKYLGISVNLFEKRVGLSNGYVKNIREGLGYEKASLIKKQYPMFNIDWLLNGKGDMLEGVSVVQNNKEGNNINGLDVRINKSEENVSKLIGIIKSQSEQMEKLVSVIDRLTKGGKL